MMPECECCQAEPYALAELPLWTEYRVGSADSPERFWLCPVCDRDPRVDPAALWAEHAEVHVVRE